MKQRIFPDYCSLCEAVAEEVAIQLAAKSTSVFVFPTGNTPLGLYKLLVSWQQTGKIDFINARIVILDEYVGIDDDDPRSLTGWLHRELLGPVGIMQQNIHGFQLDPDSLENSIRQIGGLDFVILGLGVNGHLGFNEPGSAFDSRGRQVELARETIKSNTVYWGSEDRVPRQANTLGLGTLGEARTIKLMVSGAGKSEILQRTISGQISERNPASVLRTLSQSEILVDTSACKIG